MNRRGLSALSGFTPKWPVGPPRSSTKTLTEVDRNGCCRHGAPSQDFGMIYLRHCLGNTIISPVPHWPRQIRLTRLKLIGPGQKWEPMRLELSAWEKWSTLPLKGERVSDCNSTAVVAMESHFLVLALKRLDCTALNYYECIDWFKSAEQWKTSATNTLKYLRRQWKASVLHV